MARHPPDLSTIPLTKAKAKHLVARFYGGANIRDLAVEFGLTSGQVETVLRAYTTMKPE